MTVSELFKRAMWRLFEDEAEMDRIMNFSGIDHRERRKIKCMRKDWKEIREKIQTEDDFAKQTSFIPLVMTCTQSVLATVMFMMTGIEEEHRDGKSAGVGSDGGSGAGNGDPVCGPDVCEIPGLEPPVCDP